VTPSEPRPDRIVLPTSRSLSWALAAAGLALSCPIGARAEPVTAVDTTAAAPAAAPRDSSEPSPARDWLRVQLQATDVLQYKPPMRSPYEGPNSLPGEAVTANTVDASLILGVRPWRGGQFWFDGDLNQGFAPGNTLGVAGFVNGEGAKVGHASPYLRAQRYVFRQTIPLRGGGAADVDPDMMEFGGATTRNRLVVSIGKFSLTDVMDDNAYAHDPKRDFLNWALIDTGAWDYAADAWGFSTGAVVEWYEGDWTLRGGVMTLSNEPNSAQLTKGFEQFQLDGEIEYRQSWLGREGKIKLLSFVSRGRMGRFDDAIALAEATGLPPNTALVRRYRSRPGLSINVEQPVSDEAGLFVRAGWADGRYESYEYTDIDRTFAAGGSVSGQGWGRKDDTAALALVVNGISRQHQLYLAGGGLGILVGDGRLPHPGAETILEAYYSLAMIKGVNLTFDSQTVINPAYNRDRGPAEVLGLRLHAEYR
jgi:high affinity Mn2+ porin